MAYNDEDDVNSRESLYRRFKESLSKPLSERFFDEDELVEIFDYAGDLDDSYARIEVLCCGARLYPESTQLAERRALLYFDEDETGSLARSYMADNPGISSPLMDIVALEINRPTSESAAEALDFLVEQYQHFSDEEAIRLVDLAIDLNQYDWLKSKMPQLRKKVDFLPSLLYEIMNEADEIGDSETAIALADELVELEPFSCTYWTCLFRAHARAGHESEARSAFDYAKALATDDLPALEWICETVIYLPYLWAEMIDVLEPIVKAYPDNFKFIDYRCGLLMHVGRAEEAISSLREFLRRHPDNLDALRRLLGTNDANVMFVVDAYYNAVPSGLGKEAIEEIIDELHLAGALRALHEFMSIAASRETLEVSHCGTWIEALYGMGMYDVVTQLVSSLPSYDFITAMPLKGAAVAVSIVISFKKIGKEAEAIAFMAATEPSFRKDISKSPLPIRMAVSNLLTIYSIASSVPASNTDYWEAFDPYNYSEI